MEPEPELHNTLSFAAIWRGACTHPPALRRSGGRS